MWNKQQALDAPSSEGVRELVLIDAAWPLVVEAIYSRGLGIFPIPSENEGETPAYAIAVPPPSERTEPGNG